MAKYLTLLSLLLGTNNVFSQACYCTTSWHSNTTFGQSCTANADCWACQPGAYSAAWQQAFCSGYQAPVSCSSSFIEKTEACQVNYSGVKKFKQETKTCTDGQVTVYPWQLYSDTCVQTPPSCQASQESQTLSCQTGYTGSIMQTRTSSCPNPYGQPVFGAWVTTSNNCVKSITNPTNVTSPVSPISPVNPASPTSSTSVTTTPSAPVTATTPTSVQNSPMTTDGLSAPTVEKPAPSSTAPTDAKGIQPTTKIGIKTLPLALSLEVIVKPGLTQPNMFSEPSLAQGLPLEVLLQDKTMMELLFQPSFNQQMEQNDLGFEQ